MKEHIPGLIALAFFSVLIYQSISLVLNTPIVQMTHLEQKCTRVLGPATQYDCSHLPKRYTVQWVAQ